MILRGTKYFYLVVRIKVSKFQKKEGNIPALLESQYDEVLQKFHEQSMAFCYLQSIKHAGELCLGFALRVILHLNPEPGHCINGKGKFTPPSFAIIQIHLLLTYYKFSDFDITSLPVCNPHGINTR